MTTPEVVTYYDVRWFCPHCGRWIADDAIESEDRIDPGAYYGITTRMWTACSRCGVVDLDGNDCRPIRQRTMTLDGAS